MQVQKIQNNQTSFQALRGFECSENLKPIIGVAGKSIEKKLEKALNANKLFQELCQRNDVWISINPKYNERIRSGLNLEIYASKINEPNAARRENVISYHAMKLYEPYDYERIYDYSKLAKAGYEFRLADLICDFNSRAEEIIHKFINHYNFKAAINHFFEKSAYNSQN